MGAVGLQLEIEILKNNTFLDKMISNFCLIYPSAKAIHRNRLMASTLLFDG
jgi:hypothetical protein